MSEFLFCHAVDRESDLQRIWIRNLVARHYPGSHRARSISRLAHYVSQVMTLEPGDIVSTGTPSGVGRTTNTYLKEGDLIRAEIERIGVLSNPVKNESPV